MVTRHNIANDGTWRYSGKHTDYPVEPGDVWIVGRHRFVCGDMEADPQPWRDADVFTREIACVYADTPYTAGLARSYRTKAGVDGGPGRTVDYDHLIARFVAAAQDARTVAYVETGVKSGDKVADVGARLGAEITGRWNITFYKTKPAVLLAVDFRDDPADDHPDFEGVDDDHTPLLAIEHWKRRQPYGFILDPCSGRGLTARSAQQAGYQSVNIELSPFRMAEALHSVAQLAGITPERIP